LSATLPVTNSDVEAAHRLIEDESYDMV